MVGWSRNVKRFFKRKLKWKKPPKRLTPGIKKLIKKKDTSWKITTNPKTGKRSLFSIVNNYRTQNGSPRIQRILTQNGMRYILEGNKGFISSANAKYLMGPNFNRADPPPPVIINNEPVVWREKPKPVLPPVIFREKPKPVVIRDIPQYYNPNKSIFREKGTVSQLTKKELNELYPNIPKPVVQPPPVLLNNGAKVVWRPKIVPATAKPKLAPHVVFDDPSFTVISAPTKQNTNFYQQEPKRPGKIKDTNKPKKHPTRNFHFRPLDPILYPPELYDTRHMYYTHPTLGWGVGGKYGAKEGNAHLAYPKGKPAPYIPEKRIKLEHEFLKNPKKIKPYTGEIIDLTQKKPKKKEIILISDDEKPLYIPKPKPKPKYSGWIGKPSPYIRIGKDGEKYFIGG